MGSGFIDKNRDDTFWCLPQFLKSKSSYWVTPEGFLRPVLVFSLLHTPCACERAGIRAMWPLTTAGHFFPCSVSLSSSHTSNCLSVSPLLKALLKPSGLIYLFICLVLERVEGWEKERERNINVRDKHQFAFCTSPNWVQTQNPGVCPDRELNRWLLVYRTTLSHLSQSSHGSHQSNLDDSLLVIPNTCE